jgi:hypothetical protein
VFGLPFGVFMLSEGPWDTFLGGFVRSIESEVYRICVLLWVGNF